MPLADMVRDVAARRRREGARYCPACGRVLDEEDSYCPCETEESSS